MMKYVLKTICLWAAAGLGTILTAQENHMKDFSDVPFVSVPVMEQSAAQSWGTRIQRSAGMYGFNIYMPGQHKLMPMLPVDSLFWIGTDGENLYFSAKCETGPNGPLTRAKKGYTSMVCLDDSYEFVIVPKPDEKVPDIYHVVVGNRGGYYTRAMKNNSQVVWKPEIQIQSDVQDGCWISTTILPLKLFGIEKLSDGQKIGLRFCRNWRRMSQKFGGQNGTQSSWNQNAAPFFSGNSIPVVVFRKDSPVVQVTRLRNKGKMTPAITVFNPSSRKKEVHVSCLIRPALSQPFPKNFSAVLKAGEQKTFEIPPLPVSDEEDLMTRVEVTGAKSELLYRRCFVWQGRIPQDRFATGSADKEKISLKYAYYPKTDRMFLQINLDVLGTKANFIKGFHAEVLTKDGKKIAEQQFPKKEKGVTEYLWQLPSLKECTKTTNPSGEYQLKLTAEGMPDVSIVKKFERKVFDWEETKVGTSHTVLPPFTPIRLSGTDHVSVILRDYVLSDTGLLRQITADGHILLQDGGMRFDAVINGKKQNVSGRLKVVSRDDCGIKLESDLSAGALKARADIIIEYDGMMKYELLLRNGCKVDSMRLIIPLMDKECPLMHTCTDGLRINYGGATPAGEGCVWDGSKATKIDLATTYVPYIWLGSEGPGFSVFGDNDKGWHADRNTPVQKLIRTGDKLELELDLIAKPLDLKEDCRIVLGFMATPVKPLPEDWRISVVWNQPPPFIRPYLARCERTLANSAPIGGVSPSDDIFPRDFDLTLWHTFAEIRRTGVIPEGFLDKWVSGYRNKERHEYYRRAIGHSLQVMKETGTKNPITFYTNARGMRTDIPEAVTFQDEWFKEEFQGTRERPAEYGESKPYSLDPVESFRDFAAGWYKTMITTGATDNIYFDDTFLSSNFDFSGDQDTYRLPDGQLQASVGLYNMRALIRRAATVQAELNRPSWNIVHMTNTQIAPVHSFARINLDWEDHSGLQPYQLRYTREYLRAVSIGRQTGNIPAALTMIDFKGVPRKVQTCIRSGIGVALTHEICFGLYYSQSKVYWDVRKEMYELGYGTKKAVTMNYWEKDYPVKFTGDVSSLTIFDRKGEAIVIVCNYGKAGTVTMTADLTKIGIGSAFKALNIENGQALKVQGNTVEFPLGLNDFIAIKLQTHK